MNAAKLVPIGLLVLASSASADLLAPVISDSPPTPKGLCQPADTEDDCVVDLVVSESGAGDDRSCKVTLRNAQQDVVGILRGRRVIMIWRIVSKPSGYAFTEDGIAFLDNDSPTQFVNPRRSSSGDLYWWTNRNQRSKNYEYVVQVENNDGTIGCALDPWVRNQ